MKSRLDMGYHLNCYSMSMSERESQIYRALFGTRNGGIHNGIVTPRHFGELVLLLWTGWKTNPTTPSSSHGKGEQKRIMNAPYAAGGVREGLPGNLRDTYLFHNHISAAADANETNIK
jgi:hypothetical protein